MRALGTLDVDVRWMVISNGDDLGWHIRCGLYAYCTVDRSEILYIGKVDGTSVRQRWNRSAKDGFWEDLEKERRVYEHCLLAGEVDPLRRLRLTRQLLADIESLLIRRISPWGNIQCQRTRIIRPGLRVRCLGEWPLAKRRFRDELSLFGLEP